MVSASLAFSTLFSMIPFLAVALALIKGMVGLEFLAPKFEGLMVEFLKDTAGNDAGAILRKLLTNLGKNSWGGLSAAALFFTSLGIFLNMETAVNRIWRTSNRRKLWRRLLLCLGFYALVPLGLSVYAAARSLDELKPLFQFSPLLWDAGLCVFALLFVNRLLPATKVPWPMAWVGSGVSTAGLIILKVSFTWLAISVFNYSRVYGSLAALPLFCFWILMAWQIILTGVAFAAGLTRMSNGPRVSSKSHS